MGLFDRGLKKGEKKYFSRNRAREVTKGGD